MYYAGKLLDFSFIFLLLMCAVKGLQILATFPGHLLPCQENLFEGILDTLVSIITQNFKNKWLWNLALKALINIGTYINKFSQSEKVTSFMTIVIEKINSLWTSTEHGMPYLLKLEAISSVGMVTMNYMLRIIQGIEVALFTSLSELYVSRGQFVKLHFMRSEFFSNFMHHLIHLFILLDLLLDMWKCKII